MRTRNSVWVVWAATVSLVTCSLILGLANRFEVAVGA